MTRYKNKGTTIQRIAFSDGSRYFINPKGSVRSDKKVVLQDKNVVAIEDKKKTSSKQEKQETESTGE